MDFTPSQKSAIEFSGANLQLIACAGSGKTEVVARRVVHLLRPEGGGLVPRNIVAFTFTDKAAAELKDRIVRRVHESLGEIPGLADMFVGTIHGFALELLKAEIPKYLRFEVLNDVQRGLFADRHSKQSGLTECTDLRGATLKRYLDTPRYLAALDILREADLDGGALDGCSLLQGLDAYAALLDQRSYLDYSAILDAAVDVLTNDEELRGRLAERVRCVIVDEYQDVNPIQEAIVWSLHELGAKVCAVGDDDQVLYQWRGSDVQNILTFDKRYPHVDRIPLQENFRSSEGIVETARVFIEPNADRLPKAMQPTGAQTYESGDIVALSFAGAAEEAQHIARTLTALREVAFMEDNHERGLSWSDMAILLRSVKANAEPITQALHAAGIPFVVSGMTNLFGTAEAEAARQLFYFIADRPGIDTAAVSAAWNAALLGIDPQVLAQAVAGAAAAKAALTDPEQKRWGQYSIQRVFLNFLDQAGIREETVPAGRGEVVFYNLGKFSQLISDFETIHYQSKPVDKYASFADFLQHRAEDAYPEGWQDNQYANPDAVRIMTIHQAKGMQWPVVFVPALLKNRFPAKKPGGRNVWHLLPRAGVANVVLSFSDLKYFFECPYQFKLRILYGFNAPIHEALGYGKSLHDALAEMHKRAIRGDVADAAEVTRLVETHLHAPYAYPALRHQLELSAERVLRDYLKADAALFDKIEFSEQQIEISLGDGVNVIGRIDLVPRIDTGETTIVDLKSSDRAQAEDVTETQLHIYALGYQDLTGRRPDYVEIYELDEGKRKPRSVDDDFIAEVKVKVREAAGALRTNCQPRRRRANVPLATIVACAVPGGRREGRRSAGAARCSYRLGSIRLPSCFRVVRTAAEQCSVEGARGSAADDRNRQRSMRCSAAVPSIRHSRHRQPS